MALQTNSSDSIARKIVKVNVFQGRKGDVPRVCLAQSEDC
jgi:hypothetical protein